MRLARISTIVAVCAVTASIWTAPNAAATENSTLQCLSTVPVYRVTTGGGMYHYQHLEPENGAFSWVANPHSSASAGNMAGRSRRQTE